MYERQNLTRFVSNFWKNISQALILLCLCCQFPRESTAVIFSWIQFATWTIANTQTFARYSSTARVWHIKVSARWICHRSHNPQASAKQQQQQNKTKQNKTKNRKVRKVPLLFKVIVSCWFKLFETLPAKFGFIFNSERGKLDLVIRVDLGNSSS